MDKSIKLWDLETDEHRTLEMGPEECTPMKSWPYPSAINSFHPVVLEENLRLFAGCQDGNIYMRSMAASALAAKVRACVFARACVCVSVCIICLGAYVRVCVNWGDE